MITCSLSPEQIEKLARVIAFRIKAASQNADIESFTPDLIIRGIYDDVFKSTNNPAQALDYARVAAILLDKGYGRANATIKENLKAKNSNRTEIEAISIDAEKEGGLEYIKNYLGFVKIEGELSKKQQEEIEKIETKGTVVTINFNRTKPETPLATTIQEYDEINKVEKEDIAFYTAFVKDILKNRLTNRVDGKENGGIEYPGVPGGIYLSMVKLQRIPVEQRHSSTSSDYVYVITDGNGNFIQFDNNYNVGSGKIIYFNTRPVPISTSEGVFNLYQSPYVQTPEEVAKNTGVSVEDAIESLNKQYSALSNAVKYLDQNPNDFILHSITDGSFGQVILTDQPSTSFSNIEITGEETIQFIQDSKDLPKGYYIFFPGVGVRTNAQARRIDEATAKMIADLLFNDITLNGGKVKLRDIKDIVHQYVAFSKNYFSVDVSKDGFKIKYKGTPINTKEAVIAALKELFRKVDPTTFNDNNLNLGYLEEGSNELKFRKLTKKEYLNEVYSGTKVVVNNKGEIITRNPYFITTVATNNIDKILPKELKPETPPAATVSDKKADIERRRQELESSREILLFYYFDEPIPEDSQEIRDKIEQLNKLIQESRILRAQAANEPDLDKRKELNTEAMREVPTMHELEKEIFLSRKQVLSSLPIRVAIKEAKIKGQKFLLKLRLAAKSNDWTSSMPLSEEEFNVFNDAVKKVAVKDMNEVTSNSEIIPAILLIEETLSKYDAELDALEAAPTQAPVSADVKIISSDYGVVVAETNPTKDKTQEFVDIIQPQIRRQAYKENASGTANDMFMYGLRWTRKSTAKAPLNNRSYANKGLPITDAKSKDSYAYDTVDQNGNPLAPVSDLQPIIAEIEKALGIDMSNYDAVIGNIYLPDQNIATHRDTTESLSARNYPVVVYTIGNNSGIGIYEDKNNPGSPSFRSDSRKEIPTQNGTIYTFGMDGKGRFELAHDTPKDVKREQKFPPITLPNGTVVENYTITLTFRRAADLEPGMPTAPAKISTPTQAPVTQPVVSNEFAIADTLTPIEQNFKDGSGGRKMQPQFAGKSTMDLIISGDRTRTTRAKTDISRMIKEYNLSKIEDLVGKIIRMTDNTGRQVYTRITKVSPFTQEYQDATWQKEGWVKSVTDKHVGNYPYAIEFEVVNPTAPVGLTAEQINFNRSSALTAAENSAKSFESVANVNKAKNIRKDMEMMQASDGFIGSVVPETSSSYSSATEIYKAGWGASANNDFAGMKAVMISGSGLWNPAEKGGKITNINVVDHFNNFYKPLIDKAISQGVTTFNLGVASGMDSVVSDYLKGLGYVATSNGKWNSFSKPEVKIESPVVEQGRKDAADTSTKSSADNSIADAVSNEDLLKKILDRHKDKLDKQTTVQATIKQIQEAKAWYEKSPLSKHIPFTVMFNVINSKTPGSIATWTVQGITLFKGADYSDLYHEAWHGFTQMFMTQKQRDELYTEARKQTGTFKSFKDREVSYQNATVEELEEKLAEDFREFMLGKKKPTSSTPAKKNFFEKLLDMLLALFGSSTVKDIVTEGRDNSLINDLYDKLRVGNLAGYTFNQANAEFSLLNSNRNWSENFRPADSNIYYDPSNKTLSRGSKVKYNGKDYILWNIKSDNKVQLLDPITLKKFSGTPDKSKIESVLGNYRSVTHSNKVDYIVVDNNIISLATGDTVFIGEKDPQRQQVLDRFNEMINTLPANVPSTISREDANFMFESANGLISEYVDYANKAANTNVFTSAIINDPEFRGLAYDYVKAKFEQSLKDLLVKKAAVNPDEYIGEYDYDIALLTYVIDYFGDSKNLLSPKGFIRYHLETSEYISLVRDSSVEDTTDDGNVTVKNEFEARSGNELSTQNLASSSFLNTVKSLLAVDEDGKVKLNRLGFPETANFTRSWNRIINVTEGSSTIDEVIEKLKAVSEDYPVIAQFLSKIGSPNTMDRVTVNLWTDINKILTMPRINLVSLKFRVTKKDDSISAIITPTEAMGEYTKVGKLWDNVFVSAAPSEYILRDANNNNYLDVDAIIRDYKTLTDDNIIDFMNAIGMTMDKNKSIKKALLDPEKGIKEAILKVHTTLSRIKDYNNSKYLNDTPIEESKKIIIKRPSDIVASHSNKVPDKVKINNKESFIKRALGGDSNAYKEIQKFLLIWSDDFSDTTVSNAEGENQYERSQKSSASNQVDKINRAASIIELTQEGVDNSTDRSMNHLSKSRNPFIKGSRMMKRLFDEKGNKKKFENKTSRIRLINMSGLSKELEEIKSFVNEEGITNQQVKNLFSGIASASADAESKRIQDFYMTMLFGVAEATRSADKSTTLLYKVEGQDKHYISLKNSFIVTDSFGNIEISQNGRSQTVAAFIDYISNEYERIQKLKDGDPAGNVTVGKKTYKEVATSFVIFKDVLGELASKIESIENVKTSEDFINYLNNNNQIRQELQNKVNSYLNRKEKEFLDFLNSINFFEFSNMIGPILREYGIKPEKYKELTPENKLEVNKAIVRGYIANDWISRYEATIVFQGDPALYDHSKDDFFKRNAGFASTGEFPRIDPYMISYVNKKLSQNSLAAKKGYQVKPFGRTMSTAVLEDKVTKSKYYDEYVKATKEKEETRLRKLNISEKEIQETLSVIDKTFEETYADMKEGDGQGWINFDAYRNLLTSLNLWSSQQEKLYIDIINGVDVSAKDITQFFPVKKFQYWGQLDSKGLPVVGFHKFSLMPLIPNMLKPGTGLAILQDKMLEQGVDYALFQSGSKINTITTNGKVDKFYNDNKNYQDRTVAFADPGFKFTKNDIFLDYLKDQVSVNDVYKGKNTFSTQLRKLIEQGLYEYGVPTDWRPEITNDTERVNAWKYAKPKERQESDHYNKVQRYEEALNKLVDIKKEKLKNEIGKDKKSLIEFIKKELTRQEVADHVEDFIDFDPTTNNFKHSLELSLSIEDIERLLVGVIQKRLINLNVTGESLVQVSGAGFEQSALRTADIDVMFDEGTNGLKFYRQDPVTKKTLPMQIKISMQGPFKKLLELPDVKERSNRLKISRLEALNQLISDEGWMSSNENRKLVTLVSVRIPVQGLNSMEFMEVVEFFPESSSNLIVLPAEIVAKSGGDFDIDKMFTMFPNIESKLDFNIEANVKQVSDFVGKTLTKKEIFDAKKKQNKFEDTGEDTRTEVDKKIIEALDSIDFDNMTVGLTAGEGSKAVENEILDSIKEILELADNFVNLITPNTTYDLKNLATEMAEKVRNEKEVPSATKIFEIERNIYKHQSNSIGKTILGIIAVNNTFNSVFSRTGLLLNSTAFITTKLDGTKVSHRQKLELPHNNIGGRIALSGLYAANGIKKISDIISQMINGSVDVARDAWIFDIQGNKEIIGALMFMIQAGVPADTAVYFVSQPIIQDYIRRQKEYKSQIHDVLGRNSVGLYWRKTALEDIIMEYSENIPVPQDEKGGFKKEKIFETLQRLATQGVKDNLFTNESLIKNIEKKGEFSNVDFAVFAHFIEIEEMSKKVTQITQNLNFDTTKTSNMFDARHKLYMLDEIENGIDSEAINAILENSPIGAFQIQEFILDIYKDIFPVRDNKEFVDHILGLKTSSKPGIPPAINTIKKETDLDTDEIIRRYRNDLISYIFQNSFYKFDSDAKTYSNKDVNYKVERILSLSMRSGVIVKDNTLFVDRTTLKNSFYIKDKSSIWQQGVAPVPDYMFSSAYYNENTAYELYVKFVYERETLRTLPDYSFDTISKTKEFDEYYKDLMSTVGTAEKTAEGKAYELVLRDTAAENVGLFGAMFLGQNSYASKIVKVINNKNLVLKYPVLDLISPNTIKYAGETMINLSLKGRLSKEQIDTANKNLIKLSDPNVKKVDDPIENLKISKLFKKFALFALLQSGVDTRSTFSMIKIIPNADYLALMEKPYNDFLNLSSNDKNTLFNNYKTAFKKQYNVSNKFLANRFKNYAENVSQKDKKSLGLVKQKIASQDNAFEGSSNPELDAFDSMDAQKEVSTDVITINGVNIDLAALGIGFQPNSQQLEALQKMADFIDKDFSQSAKNNMYTLMGYAGTGKSSITKILLNYIKQTGLTANVTAPTHRAKKIIKELTGKKARTIHKELGLKPDQDLEKLNLANLKFALASKNIKETPPDILIIDEASFINDGLLDSIKQILMTENYKVIFIGDPAQLRPVDQKTNSKVFDVANKSELTKVERQQEGNPLGPILDAIRSNLSSPVDKFKIESVLNGNQGVVFTTDAKKFLEQAGQAFLSKNFKKDRNYVRVVTYTNDRVASINESIRKTMGYTEEYVQGEILMAYDSLRSNFKTGDYNISNSADYQIVGLPVAKTISYGEGFENIGLQPIELDGFNVIIEDINEPGTKQEIFIVSRDTSQETLERVAEFVDKVAKKAAAEKKSTGETYLWQKYYKLKDNVAFTQDLLTKDVDPTTGKKRVVVKKTFDYGYAHTIHKSQGGTYTHIFADFESINSSNLPSEEKNQLKYVALSRATNIGYVFNNKAAGVTKPINWEMALAEKKVKVNPKSVANGTATPAEKNELDNFFSVFQSTVNGVFTFEWNKASAQKLVNGETIPLYVPVKNALSEDKVQLFKVNYPKALIVYNEAMNLSDVNISGTNSVYRALGNASYGIRTKIGLKPTSPGNNNINLLDALTDETYAENVKMIDEDINAMLNKQAEGFSLIFDDHGYGQYMIGKYDYPGTTTQAMIVGDPKAPATFDYLSQQLFEKFGYINPNWLGTEKGRAAVQKTQSVSDNEVLEQIKKCRRK